MTALERAFLYVFVVQAASIVFSIAAAQLLYVLLAIVWLAVLSREKNFSFTIVDAAVSGFFLVRILSILFSEFPSSSSLALFREVLFYPYYFIAVSFIRKFEVRGMKTTMRVLLYSAIVPSLYAVVTVGAGWAERGASFSGGYYAFSIHLAFVLAFAAVLILTESDPRRKRMYAGSLIIVCAALLSTYTRSMWIAAAACLLLFGGIGYKRWMLPIVLAMAILIGAVPSLRNRAETLLNPAQHSSGRMELWSAAMEKLPVHPFLGFGPETFARIIGDRSRLPDPEVASWHNELLQVLIESGSPALLLLLAVYCVPPLLIVSLSRRKEDRQDVFLLYFAMFSFIVILPAIVFGTIIMSILNGMILKFVLAGYSFIGGSKKIFTVYQWGSAA